MSRMVLMPLLLLCVVLAVGCGEGSTDPAKLKEQAEKKMTEAKTTFLKPITDALPGIEAKIKELTGDKQGDAKSKLEAVKKLIEEFKAAGPEKWEGLKAGLTKAFEDLKKMVGM